MSKTISFVASDRLAEWLEEESEQRMTTISSTAQQLLAEKYRADEDQEPERKSEPTNDIFDRQSRAWHRANSTENEYAVRVPHSSGLSDAGKNRYYKTRDGAEKALRRWYE